MRISSIKNRILIELVSYSINTAVITKIGASKYLLVEHFLNDLQTSVPIGRLKEPFEQCPLSPWTGHGNEVTEAAASKPLTSMHLGEEEHGDKVDWRNADG